MARHGYDEVVLLTGFPGFAARKMCEEIVAGSERTLVYAVVPGTQAEAATEALDALPLEQRGRVQLLEGDPSAMDLGLSGAEFSSLAAEVDRIHHLTPVTYFAAERKAAERANGAGTREILELASACRSLRMLVFHSSAHVSGDRTGLVLEEELEKGQQFRNPAEETLARAERRMRQAMAKLPICVVRPTMIVGDSRTGEVDRHDGPYFLFLLIVTSPPDLPLPMPGRLDTVLHIVPVDYVVRAARTIGLSARAAGRTFHVGDPAPLTVRRVFELVAAAGGRRARALPGFLPANLTKALLRTPVLDRLAKSPRAFLETVATPVTYGFANTTEVLADTDVRCPPFESYVESMVEHVQSWLRDRRAKPDEEIDDPLV